MNVIGLVVLDQAIKALAVNSKTSVINNGAALGLGSDWPQLWPGLMIVLLAVLLIKFKFNWQTGLITAGGLSNFIDRLRWGGVVDYLAMSWLPRFNLADGYILAGLIILLYSRLYEGTKDNL